MKKTLIALAALAAFGSASAEVTLYGKVDVGLSNTTTTGQAAAYAGATAPTAPVDQGLSATGNNYQTSRFGIKGGADLTGGTKAVFQLEQGFGAGDGTQGTAGSAFNRVAMAGLTGSFGTVSAGLQWTPYDSAWGWDQLDYESFSAANAAFCAGVHCDRGNTRNGNSKNSIQYTTPDFSGFNASVMYANNADKTATTDGSKYIGLGANYAAGPLNINFGYESTPTSAVTAQYTNAAGTAFTPFANDKTTAYILGASYNLGVVTIGGAFENANADFNGGQIKDSGYTLGVSAPINAATTVGASYAYEKTTADGQPNDGTAKAFGLQLKYNWTKAALVYAGFVQKKVVALTDTTEVTTNTYAAGFQYNF